MPKDDSEKLREALQQLEEINKKLDEAYRENELLRIAIDVFAERDIMATHLLSNAYEQISQLIAELELEKAEKEALVRQLEETTKSGVHLNTRMLTLSFDDLAKCVGGIILVAGICALAIYTKEPRQEVVKEPPVPDVPKLEDTPPGCFDEKHLDYVRQKQREKDGIEEEEPPPWREKIGD